MGATAAIVGGTALVGGALSANAAKSAANSQSKAANRAADASLQQFYTVNEQQAPYRSAGYTALNKILSGFGVNTPKTGQNLTLDDFRKMQSSSAIAPILSRSGGDQWAQNAYDKYLNGGYGSNDSEALQNIENSVVQAGGGEGITSGIQLPQTSGSEEGFGQFSHAFNANDLNANLAPNYQFMLDQGLGQARNQANATGGLVSGNALQGLNTFAQNYAQNAYQQAYQNYNSNQSNIFNRLASIAGLGQTANQSTANAGMASTAAANNYLTSGAAAQAAGTVGQANAYGNSLGNISDAYTMYKLFGKTA